MGSMGRIQQVGTHRDGGCHPPLRAAVAQAARRAVASVQAERPELVRELSRRIHDGSYAVDTGSVARAIARHLPGPGERPGG